MKTNLMKILKLTFLTLLICNLTSAQNLPEMVTVTGGTFTMGDEWGLGNTDELPTHEVTIKSFNISQTEVTVAQYSYYCKATGVAMPEEPSWGWQNNQPIVNVSWHDAINYADWLSDKLDLMVRLPYEAEWEYAARGGNKSNGYKYSGANSMVNAGWYSGNSSMKIHAVASNKANELGLYDMSGNIWEWCMDIYDEDYYTNSPENNPKGAIKGDRRVVRGGSFSDGAAYSRVANRRLDSPKSVVYSSGFRVVSVKKR